MDARKVLGRGPPPTDDDRMDHLSTQKMHRTNKTRLSGSSRAQSHPSKRFRTPSTVTKPSAHASQSPRATPKSRDRGPLQFNHMDSSEDEAKDTHSSKKRRLISQSKTFARHAPSYESDQDDEELPHPGTSQRPIHVSSAYHRPSNTLPSPNIDDSVHGKKFSQISGSNSKGARSKQRAKDVEGDLAPEDLVSETELPPRSDIDSYVEGLSGDDENLWSDDGGEPAFGVTRHLMDKWREWYMSTLDLTGEHDNDIALNGPFTRTPFRTPRMEAVRAIAGKFSYSMC